jgi:hypothetical protein
MSNELPISFPLRININSLGTVEIVEITKENYSLFSEQFLLFTHKLKKESLQPLDVGDVVSCFGELSHLLSRSFLAAIFDGNIIGVRSQDIKGNDSRLNFVVVLHPFSGHKLGSILTYFALKKYLSNSVSFVGVPISYLGLRHGLYLGAEVVYEKHISLVHSINSSIDYYVNDSNGNLIVPAKSKKVPFLLIQKCQACGNDPYFEDPIILTKKDAHNILSHREYKKIRGMLQNAEFDFSLVARK